MRLSYFILPVLFLGLSFGTSAQYDFDNYVTLQARGEVPADFRIPTYQKIQDHLAQVSPEKQRDIDYISSVRDALYLNDFFLHSGFVVYGDPITEHVKRVAEKVLEKRPELLAKLRFYTFKSDETNVFVTEQGIVFVSTGLISQLENDAQLAFILAHEIAHYELQHVQEAFVWSHVSDENIRRIRLLSQYDLNRELQADSLALDFYLESGFNEEELPGTYDVLAYSYLPFDETSLDASWFSSDSMEVPATVFPKDAYPIRSPENIDEDKRVYLYLSERSNTLGKELSGSTGSAGAVLYVNGREEFEKFRAIARFESLRCQVLFARYADALYSIYVLEQHFPDSGYLKRMKAQSWLGIYLHSKEFKISRVYERESEYEGESAKVHYMLKNMEHDERSVLALRTVYDLHKALPEDDEIDAIYHRMCRELAFDSKFSPADYSKKSFAQTADTAGTVTTKVAEDDEDLSKYERIRRKKQYGSTTSIDTAKYYMFGLHDILRDTAFMNLYDRNYVEYRAQKDTRSNHLSSDEELMIGANRFIVLEPRVICQTTSGIDHERSEHLEKSFRKAFEVASRESGSTIRMVNSANIGEQDSELFNERNLLAMRLVQSVISDEVESFPVDFTQMQDLIANSGTSNVLFSTTAHSYSVDLNYWLIISSAVFTIAAPFVIPVHVSDRILGGNDTRITMVVLDLETGEVSVSRTWNIEAPLTTYNIAANLYMIFKQLGTEAPQ